MFIGHYAVGFALKRAAPSTSLGWLLAAPQLPDMLWPIFLLLGWERVAIEPGNTRFTPLSFESYPYSHSLLLVGVWGVAFAAVYLVRTRRKTISRLDRHDSWPMSRVSLGKDGSPREAGQKDAVLARRSLAAVLLALGVVSHWVLDWVTHRPDLPIVPWSSEKAGLGLWNSIPATLAIEIVMYVVGIWLYARVTRPRDRLGRFGFVSLVVFLALVYIANLVGPPPPDARSVALLTLGLWLIPAWAAWADARRSAATAT